MPGAIFLCRGPFLGSHLAEAFPRGFQLGALPRLVPPALDDDSDVFRIELDEAERGWQLQYRLMRTRRLAAQCKRGHRGDPSKPCLVWNNEITFSRRRLYVAPHVVLYDVCAARDVVLYDGLAARDGVLCDVCASPDAAPCRSRRGLVARRSVRGPAGPQHLTTLRPWEALRGSTCPPIPEEKVLLDARFHSYQIS